MKTVKWVIFIIKNKYYIYFQTLNILSKQSKPCKRKSSIKMWHSAKEKNITFKGLGN